MCELYYGRVEECWVLLICKEGDSMEEQKLDYPGRVSRLSFFTKLEMAELPRLLMPGEAVLGVISGFYENGTVLLAVTSRRMLLVDKKWMRLSYEDIRFESINEVNYAQQAFLASASFYIMGRKLVFKSWYRSELRMLVKSVQDKMFEARAHESMKNDHAIQKQKTPLYMQPSPQLNTYFEDRITRWRRAIRFMDTISSAQGTD